MSLRVLADSRIPLLELDESFAAGSTVAVLGPNGAGKTTLLRVIAGLLDAGGRTNVSVGDDVLCDRHVRVPPHRRGVSLLSQDARLFPHLSVRANVAFAPAAQHLSRSEVAERVARWLAVTEVAELADRKPHELSGGQAQRVAIARALAAQPRILLLDEPFRALDIDVAGRLRALLRDVLADHTRTTIMVTHDVVDVVTLADHALVVEAGRAVDRGSVRQVLGHPANAFVARLAGLNLLAGRWDGAAVDGDGVRVAGAIAEPVAVGGPATAVFAPDAVAVFTAPPADASFRNVFRCRITQIVPHGDRLLVRAEVAGNTMSAEVTAGAVAELGLLVGRQVYFAVKATAVRVY